MKALILTCNTGEGHNSVAEAVREVFEGHGTPCRITDALSFVSEKASETICRWHTRIYRHMPGAWRVSYRLLEQHPAGSEEAHLVGRLLASGSERLHQFVAEEGYDLLICPHVFAALMVTQMRRQHPDEEWNSWFIATDYTCSPFADKCLMDRYLVPDESVALEFEAAGIPAERISVTAGVPVRRQFMTRAEKRAARAAMGLPTEGRMLLAMCGSMGCGHLDELTATVADRLPPDCAMAVVCGTNEHVYKKLAREYGGRRNIRVFGYCDEMGLLMDSADLYLTKPGGVSVSEAAVKGLPMVLVDAVAACEEPNLRHFCALGGAVTAPGPEELADKCLALLSDGTALEKMSAAVRQHGDAAEEIWELLTVREEAVG